MFVGPWLGTAVRWNGWKAEFLPGSSTIYSFSSWGKVQIYLLCCHPGYRLQCGCRNKSYGFKKIKMESEEQCASRPATLESLAGS